MTKPANASASGQTRSLSSLGRWLLLAYAVSGAAALVYEVAWMRELGNTFGATAYASATLLAAFMTGLGIGSVMGGILAKRSTSPMRDASRAELAVAGFSVIALLGIDYLPGWFFDTARSALHSAGALIALQLTVSFAVMLLPTLAMGLTFPLVMRSVARADRLGQWAGMLYSANTGGAIVGSLAAGFLLIPAMGSKGALLCAAALSVTAAVLMARIATKTESAPSFWHSPDPWIALSAIVVLALLPAPPPSLVSFTLLLRNDSASQLREIERGAKAVFDKETAYSRVSVMQYPDGTLTLRDGALIQGSNTPVDKRTTIMLGLVPLMSAEASSSAMVVGLGTGYTTAVLLQEGVERVTTVEINPGMIGASDQFTKGAFASDPAWRLVIDDARGYLMTTSDTYDVITSEPSWPLAASVAPLYTREFMQAAESRLNPGGVFCQWLPDYLLTRSDVEMMYKTARQVFGRVDLWAVKTGYGKPGEIVMVGFKNPQGASKDQIAEKTNVEATALGYPDMLLPAGTTRYEAALDDPAVPLNTDDHSRLEYRVLWNFVTFLDTKTGGR